MKKCFIALVFVLLAQLACNSNALEVKNSIQVPKTIEALYSFSETSDPKFCSPDSIIATDCGSGDLYLTMNGNAVYCYYCLGNDTTTYSLGKYVNLDTVILCTFNRDYQYYCPDIPAEAMKIQVDPNSGKMKATKTWILEMKKSICKNFEYYTPPDEEQKKESVENLKQAKKLGYTLVQFRGFVYTRSSDKETKQYRDSLVKIKALSDL